MTIDKIIINGVENEILVEDIIRKDPIKANVTVSTNIDAKDYSYGAVALNNKNIKEVKLEISDISSDNSIAIMYIEEI